MLNLINNNFPLEKVLKLRSNIKRYLKIPSNQFNEISYEDIADVLYTETDDYIELIYRFEIDDLRNGKQIRIEQKRIETKNNELIAKLKKDHEFKKAFEVEKELKGQILCEFCNKPLNKNVIMFVNVVQNPVHYFCNKDCKLNWIYQKQEQ